MGILSRLVMKQVNILLLSVFVIYSILECTCISNELLQIWKYPKLWVGFLKCVQLTKPQSFGILLQVLSSLFTPFIMNLITFFFFWTYGTVVISILHHLTLRISFHCLSSSLNPTIPYLFIWWTYNLNKNGNISYQYNIGRFIMWLTWNMRNSSNR